MSGGGRGRRSPAGPNSHLGTAMSLPPLVSCVCLIHNLSHSGPVYLQTGTIEGGHDTFVHSSGNTEALGIDSAVPLGCSGAVGEVHQALNCPYSLRSGTLDTLGPVLDRKSTR